MRLVVFGIISVGSAIAIILGMVSYSYTQINVTFDDANLSSIQLVPVSLSNLIQLGIEAFSGNWIGSALGLIHSINFDLTFGLTNNGMFPVHVPDLTYSLMINEIPLGKGESSLDMVINPGETRMITVLQNLEGNKLEPLTESLIESEGTMKIRVNGTAHFDLFGLVIPVPFESQRQVSILDELQNKLAEVQ